MSVTVNGTSGLVFSDGTIQGTAAGMPFRNRIINGDMRIDQRNNGASVSITNNTLYPVDRFKLSNVSDGTISAQRSTLAPSGFTNSIQVTVTTADTSLGATQYSFLRQPIEGLNVSDFAWGTSAAKAATLSFWVRSSVTGTFSGSIQNSAENRVYAFTYTITSANTWEYKTLTIPGDTTGTWNTDTSAGFLVNWSFGVGSTYSSTANTWESKTSFNATGSVALLNTVNATFNITGVQLEKAAAATDFEFRPIQTELAMCMRYYERRASVYDQGDFVIKYAAYYESVQIPFTVPKRASPTVSADQLLLRTEVEATAVTPSNPYFSTNPQTFFVGSTTTNNLTRYLWIVKNWRADAEL